MSKQESLAEIAKELNLTKEEECLFLDIVLANLEKKAEASRDLIRRASNEFPKVLDALHKYTQIHATTN